MTLRLSALALALVVGFPAALPAQEANQPAGAKKEEPKRDPKSLEFEKVVKDLKRIEGPFTLYQRRKEILLELPEDKLGKIFLIQAAFNTGLDAFGLQAGMPLGSQAVDAFRFERSDDRLQLVRPRLSRRWGQDDPLAISAERSYPEAILASYPVEQTDPEKKLLLVNVTSLFLGDVLRLNEFIAGNLGGPYMLDSSKSGVDSAKGFSENTVVRMKLHYMSPRGGETNPLLALLGLGGGNHLEDGRSAPVKVTYNVWFRQGDGYKPRLADPRVGYFTQDFFTLDRFTSADRTERYIQRFRLQKKDPKAALSEPVKPIVWTVDPSIPPAYRPAVKEGVLRWNKAFEALGYKNAVVVQDAPKDDPDYDHADGRYNVIRLAMSDDAGYAIALPRTDPLTGEILNASVNIDANMLSYLMEEHQAFSMPASSARTRALQAFRRGHDPQDELFDTDADLARRALEARLRKFGWSYAECSHARGLAESASFGWAAAQVAPGLRISKEEYVKRFVSDVVSHEVGHCFGLRHNFAASTHLTTAQLADAKLTGEQGIAASVMDYNPVNVQAVLRGKGDFYMPTVGAYDLWAIKYGYMEVPGAQTPVGEKHLLSQVAARSGLPGHAFLTDEDADSWNPYAVRFDASKDPLAYAERMLLAAARVRDYAIKNLPRPGEDYSKRTEHVLTSLLQTFRQGRIAARFVGGVAGNRNFRGDAGEKPTLAPVDPATQREAMALVSKHCLGQDAFNLPADVLSSMSLNPNGDSWNAPLRDVLGMRQMLLLATIMSASTTDRIVENAYKAPKAAYGVDEHYAGIVQAVFSEIGTGNSIPPLRRDLQRFAVSGLTAQAGAPSGAINEDVRAVALHSLKSLSAKIAAQLANTTTLDNLTRMHLRSMGESIDRFLTIGFSPNDR